MTSTIGHSTITSTHTYIHECISSLAAIEDNIALVVRGVKVLENTSKPIDIKKL